MKNIISFIFIAIVVKSYAQSSTNVNTQLKIRNELNYIQTSSIDLLKQLSSGLQNAKNARFSIVHFGDSHIQAEGPTSVVRSNLQNKYGDAGRGMMFAYSAANSYSSVLYSTSHTGNWTFAKSFQAAPKLPIGVSGMTVRSDEKNASLTFTLKQPSSTYQKLKIFLKKDSSSFDFKVITQADQITIRIEDYLKSKLPYIEVPITGNQSKITLQLLQNNPNQNSFEFYGMSLETSQSKGVIYHSVGVGASQFGSLLVEELLQEQLPTLSPNLLILDFGTNNYLYDNEVKPELGTQIEKIIANLRSISPSSMIMLTSTQDLYFKSKHVTAGITFRNLIDSLARKNNCLFWDWYAVSGGKKSLVKWRDAGYAQTDLVHLTNKGYEFKGLLLYDAIAKSLDSINKNPNLSALNISYSEQKDLVQEVLIDKVEKKETTINNSPKKETEPKKEVLVQNTPKKEIAPKHEIKSTVTPKKDTVPKKTQNKPSVKIHIAKKGDTLYGLAAKYKTTVSQIKKVNKLKSENLQIGQKITIP